MPLYQLGTEVAFPPPELATEEGLLAVGGDLSQARLLKAYALGIFPWYGEDDPILWWSPDPRMVLFPAEFQPSRSLRRLAQSGRYTLKADTAFDEVIEACATVPRPGQEGTWITREMESAYRDLHQAGYAHSIECWDGATLVGGLYGLSLGSSFFGESMFSNEPNASKLALWTLVAQLLRWNFTMIDCQIHTPHLESLGARCIPRHTFCKMLAESNETPTRVGAWELDNDLFSMSE